MDDKKILGGGVAVGSSSMQKPEAAGRKDRKGRMKVQKDNNTNYNSSLLLQNSQKSEFNSIPHAMRNYEGVRTSTSMASSWRVEGFFLRSLRSRIARRSLSSLIVVMTTFEGWIPMGEEAPFDLSR